MKDDLTLDEAMALIVAAVSGEHPDVTDPVAIAALVTSQFPDETAAAARILVTAHVIREFQAALAAS